MLRVRTGWRLASLARMIFAGRSALTLVLSGRRIGKQTWPKLARVLSKAEFDCARKFAAHNLAEDWLRNRTDGTEVENAMRFILNQKTRKGEDEMRLPKNAGELNSWNNQQSKTKTIT